MFIWSPHDVSGNNTVRHTEVFSTACFMGIKLIVYPTIKLITIIDNGLSVVPRVYYILLVVCMYIAKDKFNNGACAYMLHKPFLHMYLDVTTFVHNMAMIQRKHVCSKGVV